METKAESTKVALTVAERKHQLPHGASRAIAKTLGIDPSYVTKAVAGEVFPKTEKGHATLLRVQQAVARWIGRPVNEVFSDVSLAGDTPQLAQSA